MAGPLTPDEVIEFLDQRAIAKTGAAWLPFDADAPIERIAAAHQCTTAQIALAWVHAQGSDIFPIPGTKRRTYLEQNVAASGVTLAPEELETLKHAFAPGVTAGTRYPEKQMKSLGI